MEALSLPVHPELDPESSDGGGVDGNEVGMAKKKKRWLNLDLNMQGVFLHVLADCLGSVVVIVSTAIVWKVMIDMFQAFFFERLGSNSIPVLGLTQGQKFSNSVDNSLTENTGALKR